MIKNSTLFILISLTGLMACHFSSENKYVPTPRTAKGNVKLGGVFRQNETEFFRSLFPQNVTEVVGHRITNQIYEGLVRLDPANLHVKPCLAYQWEVSENATKFVFHLRKGVLFHDDICFKNGKGRTVTAPDFVYSLTKLCTPDPNNQGFFIFQGLVLGADSFYHAKENGDTIQKNVKGIFAPDDSTLVIQLARPFGGFLYRLAMPFAAVFPKEAVDLYGKDMREKTVGTGPFLLKKVRQDIGVFLVRNEHYWDFDSVGNQLPYLDGVRFSFMREEKIEMLEFKKGKLDMKYKLPMDMIGDIIDKEGKAKAAYQKYQLQNVPELSTQYYGFLTIDSIFKNVHLRRAFNYAVDRDRIVNFTVKGAGKPAFHGIVPLGMPGYDYSKVQGYKFDLHKAKEEMALAGYPDGKGFPGVTLHINSGGGRNEKIAEAITSMLKQNLNIEVSIEQAMWAQHSENSETGKYQFWRLGWVADYPDPENFLNLYYGKHVPAKVTDKAYINAFRYKNPQYDALFEKALTVVNDVERTKLYEQLDQMALADAPTLSIFYPLNFRLVQPWVHNYPANGMEYRLFREVWMDKQIEE